MPRSSLISLAALLAGVLAAGCGSSKPAGSSTGSAAAASPTATTSASQASSTGSAQAGGGSVGALSAEAKSAATGDIPDTQVFLTFHDPAAGYSISYPEGWTRNGSSTGVTFSDKNNIIHVVVGQAPAPTPASVSEELRRLKATNPTLTFTSPTLVQLKSGPAVKATYTTLSSPNPVTGKRLLLIVNRYELSRMGKRATVDEGTPRGVDNVDAYRMIVNSFRWH